MPIETEIFSCNITLGFYTSDKLIIDSRLITKDLLCYKLELKFQNETDGILYGKVVTTNTPAFISVSHLSEEKFNKTFNTITSGLVYLAEIIKMLYTKIH